MTNPQPAVRVDARVRPIDWRDHTYADVPEFIGHHAFGSFTVKFDQSYTLPWTLKPYVPAGSNFATLDEAKAAAQADYEARILSALTPAPTEAGGVREAAIDALTECEEHFDNRADADCDQDGFIPNKEMRLLSVVRTARAALSSTPAADAGWQDISTAAGEGMAEMAEIARIVGEWRTGPMLSPAAIAEIRHVLNPEACDER